MNSRRGLGRTVTLLTEVQAMAVRQFVLLTSAIVLFSAISDAATDADKGYVVTTALDGNKLGIAFYNVYEDTNGGPSVIALDSTKSSIHRISLPLSQSSAIEHISGGTPGYRDGSTKEALFNHPKKLTVDSDGTIYVADTKNAAVRMITRAGLVTTIAGGSNRTGHNDGEGSEVTFSNDFDVTYLRSTCSLAVADRGNRMIREIQLPQFIGRCGGATPNSPGSTFTSTALLMSFLAGVFITVIGAIGTILSISARRLEQLQSTFCWATTEGPNSSTWKKTVTSSSTLQVKETLTTPSSVARSAAVKEVLIWSPALIMEIVITLFEKLLYIVVYSISLPLRLLCSPPFRTSGNYETDLLGLHEQGYSNQMSIFSMSLLPAAFWKVRSSLLVYRKGKNVHPASPQVKNNLILEDLIDFLEPAATSEGSVNGDSSTTATRSDVFDSTPAVAEERVPTIDSMVERCLAKLAAPSPQVS